MRRVYAVAAATLFVLAACGDPESEPAPTELASSSTTPDTPSSPTKSSEEPSEDPSGGTADDPTEVTPEKDLLDWRDAGDPDTTVTAGDEWTVTVPESRGSAQLAGPGGPITVTPGDRFQVSDVLLDDDRAVVVTQDRLEEQPGEAIVVDLESGDQRRLDGTSTPPTVNGGTWSVGDDVLVHATTQRSAYCLATVDLDSLEGQVAWCAPKRHGFTNARVTDDHVSLMTFDDQRPSCRSVGELIGGEVQPVEGVSECNAWELVVSDEGRVWSVIPNEKRIETGHVLASTGEAYFDLGPSVSGSLTWCDDAAWFTRDPQSDRGSAQLLRWDGERLTIAYETRRARGAILSAPRCGGDAITVTALTEAGDEQVTALLD